MSAPLGMLLGMGGRSRRRRRRWTPLQLPGLVEWWDASHGLSLREDDGTQFVQSWTGRLQELVLPQESEPNQPILTTSVLGGASSLRMADNSGANPRFLQANLFTLEQPFTVLAVYHYGGDRSNAQLIDGQGSSNRLVLGQTSGTEHTDGTTGRVIGVFAGSSTTTYDIVPNGDNSGAFLIDGPDGHIGFQNGVSPRGEISSPGTGNWNGLTLGARFGGTDSWRGTVAQLLVLEGAIAPADLNRWLAYVKSRYGIDYTEVAA